jgi:N-acetylmuramoyl-L-alanine amidase
MPTHVVRQGEHLAAIARRYGFSDYRTIWEHSQNAALRQRRRGNPNVLWPGDEIFIPDLEERSEDGATEQRHRFVRHAPTLQLRLRIRDIDGKPVPRTNCELYIGLERVDLVTDSQGMIEYPIPVDAENGRVKVPSQNLEFDLRIGHLDPIGETPGQRARLNNLGYFAGYSEEDTRHIKWAVEEFQCENGIRPTGECDEPTQEKLLAVYGT